MNDNDNVVMYYESVLVQFSAYYVNDARAIRSRRNVVVVVVVRFRVRLDRCNLCASVRTRIFVCVCVRGYLFARVY